MSEADKFDAEVGGLDEYMGIFGKAIGWLPKILGGVKKIAGGLKNVIVKTKKGNASGEAFQKAGEIVDAAHAGDKDAQKKVATVDAAAATGDSEAQQAKALLQLANELYKKAAAKAEGKASVGAEFDVEHDLGGGDVEDADDYEWGW